MSKSIFSILTLVFSLAVFTPLSQAADQPSDTMKNSVTQACKSDIQQYCSDVKQDRVMSCLHSHDDKLSSGCSKEWTEARAQWKNSMKAAHAACSGDVQKFCSSASDPKDVMNCLSDHTQDLSSSCKDFRSKNNMSG
jgi:hypothetical protein